MSINMEAQCRMAEILMTRSEIKILQQKQDLLIFNSIMWNAFKINGGNRISLFTDIRWRVTTQTSDIQDKPSELRRMVELSQK